MATAANWQNGQAFSVGEVLSRAFAVMASNPLATFGIAFLFGALPQQLFEFALTSLRIGEGLGTTGVVLMSLGSVLVSMLLGSLVGGAIVRVTLAFAESEKARFGESVMAGLAKALPLLGLALVTTIALVLGFALLLVPGVILLVLWAVASPALVAEDIGVTEAFGRSRELTKGARWRVFGLGIVMVVIFWIFSAIAGVALVVSVGLENMGDDAAASIPFMVFSAVIGTLTSAFIGTVQTSLYIALRDWKDGPRVGALADVFA